MNSTELGLQRKDRETKEWIQFLVFLVKAKYCLESSLNVKTRAPGFNLTIFDVCFQALIQY